MAPRSGELGSNGSAHSAEAPRVLLADQDPGTIELLGACIARTGWSLHTVSPGPPLIEALERADFDLVITDLLIPGLDGLSLLRKIRSHQSAPQVIVVSSGGSLGDFVSLLKEGVSDVLQKPIDSDALARSMKRVVSSARDREKSDLAYRHVTSEHTEYSFNSKELAESRPTLTILDRLYWAQLIDLSTKLKFELAFQEVIANALEHGNLELESRWKEEFDSVGMDRFSLLKRERLADKRFSERRVTVIVDYQNRVLSVTVQDQGNGFIPKIPDEWKTGSVVPHGRGLAMIYAASDEVLYENNGTCITLRKRVGVTQ